METGGVGLTGGRFTEQRLSIPLGPMPAGALLYKLARYSGVKYFPLTTCRHRYKPASGAPMLSLRWTVGMSVSEVRVTFANPSVAFDP